VVLVKFKISYGYQGETDMPDFKEDIFLVQPMLHWTLQLFVSSDQTTEY